MDDPADTNQGQNNAAFQDPNAGQVPQMPQQPGQPAAQPYQQPQYQSPMPASQPPAPQAGPAPQPDGSGRPPLRIDDALLSELGLGALPEDERKALQKHIYETLEMNVGMRLADQMTNEQLDEFEQYFNARDDAGAFRWLETNFPNYKDIVADEFEKLKGEVAQNASQIVAASQQQAAAVVPDQTQQLPPEPTQPSQGPPADPPSSDPQTSPPNYQP